MAQVSSVEDILNRLSKLENEIERIDGSIEDVRRSLINYTDEEIEKLRERLLNMAHEEAARIIAEAKKEAEAEAARITAEGEKQIVKIRSNIDRSFNNAVDIILKKILTA